MGKNRYKLDASDLPIPSGWHSDPIGGRPVVGHHVLARIANVAPITGNSVHLLRDATENYPAWLDSIAAARKTINFENYIIGSDAAGQRFAEALLAKAQEGVKVRLLYDWLGSLGSASASF